jgi:TolB-like protein
VFLSYASQDAEPARNICDALRAAGIEVWFDQSELRGGDAWDRRIREQIHACRLFIAVISAHTETRDEGYFRREWRLAVERAGDMAEDKAFVVPLAIDGTSERSARVPDLFKYVQWMRLPGGETTPAFVERVKRLLSSEGSTALREPAGAEAASAGLMQASAQASSLPKRGLLIAVAVATLAAAAYFAIEKLWSSKPAVSSPTVAASAAPAAFNPPPPQSVVVLPFTNLSGDPKQEYFSDGLSEELINALSNIDSLRVIARTTSFSFKGKDVDIGTIARKLNVAAVLEGSVRRSGSTVRVTAQLIDATNGFHLWSQDYDRELTNILQLQSDIAASVAQHLRATLAPGETDQIQSGGTHIPEAYDAFLHAKQLANAADTDEEEKAALQAADEAIALDPGYAAAYALRARLLRHFTRSEPDPVKKRRLFDLARQAADRAVVLAPNFADGHLILGWHVLMHGFLDIVGGAREIRRGVQLAPGSATAQDYFAGLELVLDHRESTISVMRRAVNLDPQNYNYRLHMVDTFYYTRRFAQVPDAARDAYALKPASHDVTDFLVLSYLGLGQADRARQACESAATPLNDDDRHFCLTLAYAALGDLHRADIELEKFKASDSPDAYAYAEIYAQRGDKPSALHWLAKAEAARDPELTSLRTNWLLDPIRSTPEFNALERRLNFPP